MPRPAYLGLTVAQIQASVAGGQTLAQIATATSGKTTAGLVAALVTHETAEINAKVTAGKLTRAQAGREIATLTATFTAYVNGTGGPHGPGERGGHRGPGGGHSDELDAAAAYLGLTPAELIAKVQAGQTLAQIAAATSARTRPTSSPRSWRPRRPELAAAVTAGRITQAQADAIIPTLTANVHGIRERHRRAARRRRPGWPRRPARRPLGTTRSERRDRERRVAPLPVDLL